MKWRAIMKCPVLVRKLTLLLLASIFTTTACECDPTLFVQFEKHTSSTGSSDDWFTHAMDLDGDLMVASSISDAVGDIDAVGSIFVWEHDVITGSWSQTARLFEIDDDGIDGIVEADYLGADVAISNRTIVAGADYAEHTGTDPDAGIAIVFQLDDTDASVWTMEQILTASDAGAGDRFGYSTDIDGDTIVVGAPSGNAAYVFVRNDTNYWEEQQILTPDSGATLSYGKAVAIEGDLLVVGNDNTVAEVYERGGTSWARTAILTGDRGMGGAIDIDGGRIVVGVYESDSVYVYSTDYLNEEPQILTDGRPQGKFGLSVNLVGTSLAVGAPEDPRDESGRAYLYRFNKTSNEWYLAQDEVAAQDAQDDDQFGFASVLKADGTAWLIGARFEDDAGSSAGAFYAMIPDPCTQVPSVVPTAFPSYAPTPMPSQMPSARPSSVPSIVPSNSPTTFPSVGPTRIPSVAPSAGPTRVSSVVPTVYVPPNSTDPSGDAASCATTPCGPLRRRVWMHKTDPLGVTCRPRCTFPFMVERRQNRGWECGRCFL